MSLDYEAILIIPLTWMLGKRAGIVENVKRTLEYKSILDRK